ncbi:sensor histidine kinase [Spirillospora sp. CA-128828]|uniref:sensor histidine kinase n=1 Tax=Spirillospora sp. CA-128828 TaxID=3240033 RepID=UPI003D8BE5D3
MREQWKRAFSGNGYLLGALGTALASLLALPLWLVPGLAGPWAEWHRGRAGRLLGDPVTSPGARWALLWPIVHGVVGGVFGLAALLCLGNLLTVVTVPFWWAFPAYTRPELFWSVKVNGWGTALVLGPAQVVVLGAVAFWVLPVLARVHARVCLAFLSPPITERLSARIDVLTRTRARVVDAHGAELQRIERDLHDGTQARLVTIAMCLGMARESLTDDAETVAVLLRQAHETAEEAMVELRTVLQTIYPPILADRGLDGALASLAARSRVPVRADVGELGAIPAAVEAVAYYVVAEALTNVAKHGGADRAAVRVGRAGDRLSIEVTDDGVGGADETRGTGIAGIRRRVLALDGTVRLSSPEGGPTTLAVRLPCAS